jgi:hypothetical protein
MHHMHSYEEWALLEGGQLVSFLLSLYRKSLIVCKGLRCHELLLNSTTCHFADFILLKCFYVHCVSRTLKQH